MVMTRMQASGTAASGTPDAAPSNAQDNDSVFVHDSEDDVEPGTEDGGLDPDAETRGLETAAEDKGKRKKRHQGVDAAPSRFTDLPWDAMAGITSQEIITFFPNHACHWPAICARLVEDGWGHTDIANYINQTWCSTNSNSTDTTSNGGGKDGSNQVVLSNTVSTSVNVGLRQFPGKYHNYASWKTDLRKRGQLDIRNKTAEEILAAKRKQDVELEQYRGLFETTAWKAVTSDRYYKEKPLILKAAWSLRTLAEPLLNYHGGIPCQGPFTERVMAAFEEQGTPEDDSQTPPTAPQTDQNPPILPAGWNIQMPSEAKDDARAQAIGRKANIHLTSQPKNKSDGTSLYVPRSKAEKLQRSDMATHIRNDPRKVMETHPEAIWGETLLWLRESGWTIGAIREYIAQDHGKRKQAEKARIMTTPGAVHSGKQYSAPIRETFSKRNSSALAVRAKRNGRTCAEENEDVQKMFKANHSITGAGNPRGKKPKAESVDQEMQGSDNPPRPHAANTAVSVGHPVSANSVAPTASRGPSTGFGNVLGPQVGTEISSVAQVTDSQHTQTYSAPGGYGGHASAQSFWDSYIPAWENAYNGYDSTAAEEPWNQPSNEDPRLSTQQLPNIGYQAHNGMQRSAPGAQMIQSPQLPDNNQDSLGFTHWAPPTHGDVQDRLLQALSSQGPSPQDAYPDPQAQQRVSTPYHNPPQPTAGSQLQSQMPHAAAVSHGISDASTRQAASQEDDSQKRQRESEVEEELDERARKGDSPKRLRECEVEAILDKRIEEELDERTGLNKVSYLVQWKDTDSFADSWELKSELRNCRGGPDAIEWFAEADRRQEDEMNYLLSGGNDEDDVEMSNDNYEDDIDMSGI